MDAHKLTRAMDIGGALMSLAMRIIDAVKRDDSLRVDEILSSPLAVAVVQEAARLRASDKFGE